MTETKNYRIPSPKATELADIFDAMSDEQKRDYPEVAGLAAWVAARDAARVAAWDAAWDAAQDAAWVAARDAAWVAARDASLYTQTIHICDGLDLDPTHTNHAIERWRVWQKGYGLYCDVDGVRYVYEAVS